MTSGGAVLRRGGRLVRTLRPLPLRMLGERLRFEVRARVLRGIPPLAEWVLRPTEEAARVAILVAPAHDAEVIARARSTQHTATVTLAGHTTGPRQWHDASLPKLVRYHLHYLDTARDLVHAGRIVQAPVMVDAGLQLVRDWDADNPLRWSEGWEPYPVASRLKSLAWIAAHLGPDAPAWLIALISNHGRYLARWPEEHLRGNHLWRDWAALAMGAAVLHSDEAVDWRDLAESRLKAVVGAQVLADGGHYERSAMYHFITLEDLLDVRDLLAARAVRWPWLESAAARMAAFGRQILHPDGEVPLFNDAVLKQGPSPRAVLSRIDLPRTDETPLFDAGIYGLTVSRADKEALIIDTGPLGPDEQPGHSHSDTLSFELSVGGVRRIVNGGVDGYQSERRAFFRSAAAHNTVTVDGEGPDELWSAFRLGGRSTVLARSVSGTAFGCVVHAKLRAFQGWTQDRTILHFSGKAVVVVDDVHSDRGGLISSAVRVAEGDAPLTILPLAGQVITGRSLYAPELGRVQEVDEWRFTGSGRDVRLAYAVVFGQCQVKLQGRRLSVDEHVLDI